MKIRYITSHGMAKWTKTDNSEQENLTLCFEPYHNGMVVLDGKMFKVKCGEVTIPMKNIPDGEYTPKLETESGVYSVEGFIKQGNSITAFKSDESLIRYLLLRCYNLERSLFAIGERVAKLEEVCHGHKIFDFERKEK